MKFTLLVFALCVSFQLMAQKGVPPPPPPASADNLIKNDYCVLNVKYDDKRLLQVFPFKQAGLIKVVVLDIEKPIIDSGAVISMDSSYWKEEFIIPKDQYKEVSKLMFNFGPSKKYDRNHTWEIQGYQPTHAVVFYDQKNKVIAVTELSFRNNKIRTYPSKSGGEKKCSTILGYYRSLFNRIGIDVPNY